MDNKVKNLNDFVDGVKQAIAVIDRYEKSRECSLCFTKLEEAILWAQVMVGQVELKTTEATQVEESTLISAA